MIVLLQHRASAAQADSVCRLLQDAGCESARWQEPTGEVIGAVGLIDTETDEALIERLEHLPFVDRVARAILPYPLASREWRDAASLVSISTDLIVGGEDLVIIAGPCSVESREGLLRAAREVKSRGANALRGGAFKPRTSPHAFQGLGAEGLA